MPTSAAACHAGARGSLSASADRAKAARHPSSFTDEETEAQGRHSPSGCRAGASATMLPWNPDPMIRAGRKTLEHLALVSGGGGSGAWCGQPLWGLGKESNRSMWHRGQHGQGQ